MKLLALNILAALALSATALSQTYRAVTADTNNVIRTNFTLAFPQVTFAGGSSNSVPVVSGGTGATNAAGALVNLFPSYTGNSNAVLALNSNATAVVWSTNAGGGSLGTNFYEKMTNLGIFLQATNSSSEVFGVMLAHNGDATNEGLRHIVIGTGAQARSSGVAFGVSIGEEAITSANGIAIGNQAQAWEDNGSTGNITRQSVSIGGNSEAYRQGIAIGESASASYSFSAAATNSAISNAVGGIAVGKGATTWTFGGVAIGQPTSSGGSGAYADGGVAIGINAYADGGVTVGSNAYTEEGVAIGSGAYSESADSIAIGFNADSSVGVQIGTGSNTDTNTIQFMSAGTIDTNEWSHLAALSTYPTTNISVVGTNNTNTLVFSNGILTSVTSP